MDLVDHDLTLVIAQVESAGNRYAVRFEETVWDDDRYARTYAIIMKANECSRETAAVLASCSWGAFQIMGGNLYSQGYSQTIGAYLSDDSAQRLSFQRFLKGSNLQDVTLVKLTQDQTLRQTFIRAYNGPGDVSSYWLNIQAAIVRLGIKI